MTVKLLAGHRLEFLSLKGGSIGSSESTLAKCHIVGNHMSWLILRNRLLNRIALNFQSIVKSASGFDCIVVDKRKSTLAGMYVFIVEMSQSWRYCQFAVRVFTVLFSSFPLKNRSIYCYFLLITLPSTNLQTYLLFCAKRYIQVVYL